MVLVQVVAILGFFVEAKQQNDVKHERFSLIKGQNLSFFFFFLISSFILLKWQFFCVLKYLKKLCI